jgi:hypothetical protein
MSLYGNLALDLCSLVTFPGFSHVAMHIFLTKSRLQKQLVADPDPHVLGLPDPDLDPLVRGMDPDPALDPDPSIIMQK